MLPLSFDDMPLRAPDAIRAKELLPLPDMRGARAAQAQKRKEARDEAAAMRRHMLRSCHATPQYTVAAFFI